MNRIQRAAETKANKMARKKVSAVKNSAKIRTKEGKKTFKKTIGKGINSRPEDSGVVLDELIEDEQAKGKIKDVNNKKRFVNLFGKWLSMPNDLEVRAKATLDSLKNLREQIDSSDRNYRVPKKVRGYDNVELSVLGFHPHWMGNAYKSYDYDILSHISYYSYDINPETGGAINPEVMRDFMGGDFVQNAHERNTKVLLTVSCHGTENIDAFLIRNEYAQQAFRDSILYILDSTKADGIDINFEGLKLEHQRDFTRFVRIMSQTLMSQFDTDTSFSIITVTLPPFEEEFYDVEELYDYVDYFIVQGFGLHSINVANDQAYPTSPLNFYSVSPKPDIHNVVTEYTQNLSTEQMAKFILNLPYYAVRSENGVFKDFITYSDLQYNFLEQNKGEVIYDSLSATYSLTYSEVNPDNPKDTLAYTIYYDDVRSLRKKYTYIYNSGMGGVGLWALGYDLGYMQLWNLLWEEFTVFENPIAESKEKLKEASNTLMNIGVYILAVLLYLAIFIAIGFSLALLKVEVRQKLFMSTKFRVLYILVFTSLILTLGAYLNMFKRHNFYLTLGIILGTLVAWFALNIVNKKKEIQP